MVRRGSRKWKPMQNHIDYLEIENKRLRGVLKWCVIRFNHTDDSQAAQKINKTLNVW